MARAKKNGNSAQPQDAWRSRIVGYGEEAPDQLLANDRNWRGHPKPQQDALLGVLHEVGIVQNILVNRQSGKVVDGHLRVALALREGQKSIPVTYVDLTDAEEVLVLATLDPLSALAFADKEKLGELLEGVQTGEAALQQMLAELAEKNGLDWGAADKPDAPEPEIDRAAELQAKWGVKLGQLWAIGEHRLICGDCTDKAIVERVMGGEKAALTVTSPPYFVGKEYEQQKTEEDIITFVGNVSQAMAEHTLPNRRIVINCATTPWSHIGGNVDYRLNLDWWQIALREMGWLTRSVRIWSKHGGLVHNAPNADIVDMHWEYLATFYHPKAKPHRGQNRVGEGWATSGIWDGIRGENETVHSAPFPVVIPERFVALYTDDGEAVLEPFCGSGTTIVACERLKRKARACEISPGYVAVTLERLAAMGLTPELVESSLVN